MVSAEEAKSVLKPLFDACLKSRDEHDFETAVAHFDPNAVFVQKGKRIIFGRERKRVKVVIMFAIFVSELKKEHTAFKEITGKRDEKITNEQYALSGDFGVVSADYEIKTEKIGELKGSFMQIWRKSEGKWLVLHEEFSMDLEF
ncbi:unnamed protein product [Cylicostephanus goldi]|uniref:DUF4440 domain-containing protein n=1 Tax=Cylicostephanus goldi TaxID=71465 RepID=A0A3P6ULP1_CYLGO|nr:unnamed protein product [Cylicostephanus goldi]